jgi:hypothetical protein
MSAVNFSASAHLKPCAHRFVKDRAQSFFDTSCLHCGMSYAAAHPGKTPPPSIAQPKEPNAMSPIKLEARTYITLPNTTTPFNATELSDDQLLAAIQQSEAEIERLGKIKAQPKTLKQRVADLQAGIDALVALLDERADAAEGKKSKK